MNRCFLILLICTCQAALLARAADASEPLRWKLVPGQKFRIESKIESTRASDFGRGEPSRRSNSFRESVLWVVESVDAKGNAKILQQYERIQARSSDLEYTYDSDNEVHDEGHAAKIAPYFDALTKHSVTLTMAPNGEMLDCEVPEALLKDIRSVPDIGVVGAAVTEDGLKKQICRDAFKLPDEELEIGDEWTLTNQAVLTGGRASFSLLTYTYQGTTQVDGEQFERFTGQIRVPDRPSIIRVTDSNIESKVEALFSRKEGHLSSWQLNQKRMHKGNWRDEPASIDSTMTARISMRPIDDE